MAADTGFGDGSWIREAARHGPFRLAMIPIGGYAPRNFTWTHHINPKEAVRIFGMLDPAQALGVHWGTFQVTFEPIDEPRQRLKALKRARRVAHDRFIVIEAGQSIAVPQPSLMPRPENPFRGNAIVGLSSFGVKTMKQALALLAIAGLGVVGCNRAETPEAENIIAAAENEAQALENEAAAVEEMAENKAEAASASLENKAEGLRNEAEAVREKAENKAEAIEKSVTNAM